MACDAVYDIMGGECYYQGSTLEEITIEITNTVDNVEIPVDLTGANVRMQWRKPKGSKPFLSWSLDDVISVSGNIVTIAKHTPIIEAGDYYSDLFIQFANEDAWTGVGKFKLTVNNAISV